MAGNLLTNLFVWMIGAYVLIGLCAIFLIFIVIIFKVSHASAELKAWWRKYNIAIFFEENKCCQWKPVKPYKGMIKDKQYGYFLVNEKATYIDKRTKAILIPFDASIENENFDHVKSKDIGDKFYNFINDEERFKDLRWAVGNDALEPDEKVEALKTTIHFGTMKNMITALVPHNINAKIEKIIAERLRSGRTVDFMPVAIVFCMIFGAILMGTLIMKLTLP